MNDIKVLDIIKESKPTRKDRYIEYFFKNFALIKDLESVYEPYSNIDNMMISIIKDSTSRILENKKGKLMERSWRNCVFYFIDKQSYKKYFGTNERYPTINFENGYVKYNGNYEQSNSIHPNALRTHYSVINGIQNEIFNYFRDKHSSWFVRSYVYFIMVLCDSAGKIENSNYHIHYWNTNYNFNRVPQKVNIFNNVSDSVFVKNVNEEIKLIETSNRDVIECVKAFSNDLDFRNQTEENYKDIKNDIDNGINYVLVEGAARTGKTIIAMRLMGEYLNSILLIMNYYFYVALKDAFNILDVDFPKERIFHHSLQHRKSGCWIEGVYNKRIVPNLEFLIVDEAQRLALLPGFKNRYNGRNVPGIDEIDKIINYENQKHTIFLGDNLQLLNPKYDEGFNRIYDLVKDKNFREYKFKKTIGISSEILENIKYLLNMPNGGQVQPTHKFKFRITNKSDKFIKNFEEDATLKKHYVGVGLDPLKGSTIKGSSKIIIEFPKDLIEAEFPYLFNLEVQNKYILSTYQVISREIESVYLYLPNEVTYDPNVDEIVFESSSNKHLDSFLVFHIYTLMTRATLKLSILCENQDLYEYLSKKIDNIEQMNVEADRIDSLVDVEGIMIEDKLEKEKKYDYDFFIAYHGTIDPNGSYQKAKEICDFLKGYDYKVFLNDYSSNEVDSDLGFNETRYIIQRSNKFLLIFNDNIYRDEFGMLPRKYEDGKPNQLYFELVMFSSLVDDDLRSNKHNLKFFYSGEVLDRKNVYGFLNNLYRNGTMGNSNCCFFKLDELLEFARK